MECAKSILHVMVFSFLDTTRILMFKYNPITYKAAIIVSRTIEVAMLKSGMITIDVLSSFQNNGKISDFTIDDLKSYIDILCTITRYITFILQHILYIPTVL